jgi:hypothetical protein
MAGPQSSNPKVETRSDSENRNPNVRPDKAGRGDESIASRSAFRIPGFGVLSNFEFRPLGFDSASIMQIIPSLLSNGSAMPPRRPKNGRFEANSAGGRENVSALSAPG